MVSGTSSFHLREYRSTYHGNDFELQVVMSSILKLQRWWRDIFLQKRIRAAIIVQSRYRRWIACKKVRQMRMWVVCKQVSLMFCSFCVIIDPLSFNVNTVQEYFLAAKNTVSCYCTVPISEMDCLRKSSAIENVGPSHPSMFNASFILCEFGITWIIHLCRLIMKCPLLLEDN